MARLFRAARLPDCRRQFINGRGGLAIHIPQRLEKFRCPAGAFADSLFECADDEAVSAQTERFGPAID